MEDNAVNTSMDASEVYDHLLFHTGRFRCLRRYKSLTPYSCTAIAVSSGPTGWYGNYFSQINLLGNPALRDAMLHAVQGCVPFHTLIPVSAKEVLINKVADGEFVQIEAVELFRDKEVFCFNIVLKNASDEICEAWYEVKFSVLKSAERKKLNLTFAQIALQRKMDEISLSQISIDLFSDLTDMGEKILRRADGKPYLDSDEFISLSHQEDTKMMVKGQTKVGCDIERVNLIDPSTWNVMLGKEKSELASFIAASMSENYSVSATRLWSAMECLKKSGDNLSNAIAFHERDADGFVIFNSGSKKIISYCTWIEEINGEAVFSILT